MPAEHAQSIAQLYTGMGCVRVCARYWQHEQRSAESYTCASALDEREALASWQLHLRVAGHEDMTALPLPTLPPPYLDRLARRRHVAAQLARQARHQQARQHARQIEPQQRAQR
eukprot:365597-Chlamydomonas_euryale.AAC.3